MKTGEKVQKTLTYHDGETDEFTVYGGFDAIAEPGKFEGEPLFVPYFYRCGLDGHGDYDENNNWVFEITDDDRGLFPDLADSTQITIIETESGFVGYSLD